MRPSGVHLVTRTDTEKEIYSHVTIDSAISQMNQVELCYLIHVAMPRKTVSLQPHQRWKRSHRVCLSSFKLRRRSSQTVFLGKKFLIQSLLWPQIFHRWE